MAQVNIPKNPDLVAKETVWKRISALVADNEKEYKTEAFCKKFPNEPNAIYKLRQPIFSDGFINPTIELISAAGHTIYGNEIDAQIGNRKNTRLSNFMENCTMGDSASLIDYMRENICPMQRAYGTSFVMLDMPNIDDGQTEAYQIANRIYPYITRIEPLNVRNYVVRNGEIVWFAYDVTASDTWDNPLLPEPPTKKQIRIWTKTDYIVLTAKSEGDYDIDAKPNRFGFVPVIIQASFKPKSACVIGESPFMASSRQIISANNMLHIVNMELMKHANAMLLVNKASLSAHNSTTNDKGEYRLKTIPEDNAFIYTGDSESYKPSYLVRDLETIPPAIEQYRLYMNAAFDNEKAAKSVAKEGYGGDDVAKSGFALIVEREPILANIVATALDMQSIHQQVLEMADNMINDGNGSDKIKVEYDMDYDIQAFSALLDETKKVIDEIRIPSSIVKKEQHKRVAARVVTEPDKRKEAFDEIENHDYGSDVESDENIKNEINGLFGGQDNNNKGDEDGNKG